MIALFKKWETIGLLKWDLTFVGIIGGVLAITLFAILPIARSQYQFGQKIVLMKHFLDNRESLDDRSARIAHEQGLLDSLIRAADSRDLFDEPLLIARLYELADSSGFAITKLQIDAPVQVADGREIPVIVKGTGKYEIMGKFIEGVENLNHAVRIRQLTLKGEKGGQVVVALDFIILENRVEVPR